MLRRWTENLKKHLFASGGGHLVFYPLGPFKGYVVGDPSYQRVIVAWISGLMVLSLVTSIIMIAIGGALGLADGTTMVIGLIDFLLYLTLTHRLTKGLASLSFNHSFRFYAHCTDAEELWQRLVAGIILLLLMGSSVLLNLLLIPGVMVSYLLLGTAVIGLLTITNAALLYVRGKSRSASPGVPGNADFD